MADREKVIADLRRFINYPEPLSDTVKDAMELLKKQEPVKPMDGWLCGQCGCRIYRDANYCYNCGRKVMWE